MNADISSLSDLSDVPVLFYIAIAVLAAWGGLMAFRGEFWRAEQRLSEGAFQPDRSPPVAVVIPARNEADLIGRAVTSIRAQDYAGDIAIWVVDDRSTDRTADAATGAGAEQVIAGRDTPSGWTGKMWAVAQGVDAVRTGRPDAAYLWLTDADIEHHPGELASLVAGSESGDLDLNSVMVRLHVTGIWDILLIPAFVFFFQKLFPFQWVNDPQKKTAAAAGGSMLVRRSALDRIGGIEAVRGELIDDCALARRIKSTGGGIRLSLADETRSIRPYESLAGIWRMVARTAFHQLGYSPVALIGTVLGMLFLYLAPPAIAISAPFFGELPAAVAAFAAWFAMGWAFAPTLYRYDLSPWYGFTLPVAGFLYAMMTIDSARRHWQGTGGEWKGRTYQP